MVLTDTPGSCFDKVAMDIVGPLEETTHGNKYMLTMQDLLSKYSIIAPLTGITSMDIADALLKRLIYVYGAPKAILTDQAANFTSVLLKNIAKLCKVKKYVTTSFWPQANGSIERMHHSLTEWLKNYTNKVREWDEWCECAAFSYNTSVHEGTKLTPYECVFGKIARVPSATAVLDEDITETYMDYLTRLKARLRDIQDVARENLIHAKQRSKEYYDRRLNPCVFEVGDNVMLVNDHKKNKKDPEYAGPFKIIAISENGVNVTIVYKNNKPRVVHSNKLRKTRL